MKKYKITRSIIIGLFAGMIYFLSIPAALGQSEKIGRVSYTPPQGWKKTSKENIVTFSEVDEAAGKFCFITLYGATDGGRSPQSDFTREWNNLAVKPFGAEANPKTETELVDEWTATAGGSAVDFQGTKAVAFLTVLSNSGKTVSILGVFNDESYLAKLVAFNSSIEIEKAAPAVPLEKLLPETQSGSAAIHASTLVKEFESNEIRAGQTWTGRRVRIFGTVNSIDVQKDGRISLIFKSSISTYGNARCYFNKSEALRVAQLNAHQEATVEGTVRGWEGGYSNAKVYVLLDGCTVP